MRRPTVLAGISLLLTFLGGAAAGFFAHRLYSSDTVKATTRKPTPEEYRIRYVDEMTRRLSLSAEQRSRLSSILDASRLEFREKIRPQMQALHEREVQQVEAMLSAEQRTEYQLIREEKRRKREAERGIKGSGGKP